MQWSWLRCGALVAVGVLGTSPAAAELPDYIQSSIERSVWYAGLLEGRELAAADYGDVDGDGINEAVIAFREAKDPAAPRGGILIFTSRDGEYVKAFGGVWDDAAPTGLTVGRQSIDVELSVGGPEAVQTRSQKLEHGRHYVFDDEPGGLRHQLKLAASSTLTASRGETRVEYLMDGRLESGWAEGAIGTGVSEWVSLSFARPVDIAWIGVAGGNNASKKKWRLFNRINRAELRVITPSEEGDPAAGVDYGELGLVFAGTRHRVDLPDRMGMHYLRVDGRSVTRLELRVSSVYLGDRFDDLWIAEVDVLARLPTPERAMASPAPPGAPAPGAGAGSL